MDNFEPVMTFFFCFCHILLDLIKHDADLQQWNK